VKKKNAMFPAEVYKIKIFFLEAAKAFLKTLFFTALDNF